MGLVPIKWSKFLARGVPALLSAFTPPAPKATPQSAPKVVAATVEEEEEESAPGLSLATILEVAKRTAGNTIPADVPLMEAGIDSL
eukprot:1857777-Prymnesium_polylepis.1